MDVTYYMHILSPLYHHFISPIPNLNIWIFQDGQVTSAIHNHDNIISRNIRKQQDFIDVKQTPASKKSWPIVNPKTNLSHHFTLRFGPMMQALFPDAVDFFPRTNWTGWSFDMEYSCSHLACDQMMTLLEKL